MLFYKFANAFYLARCRKADALPPSRLLEVLRTLHTLLLEALQVPAKSTTQNSRVRSNAFLLLFSSVSLVTAAFYSLTCLYLQFPKPCATGSLFDKIFAVFVFCYSKIIFHHSICISSHPCPVSPIDLSSLM